MGEITDDLAALPALDSIAAVVEQVSPIRVKYLNAAREQNARDQAGDPLVISRLQAVNDACDRFIQLAVVRLHPRGSICTYPLSLLTDAERAGL
jgi:hypothetical protein